MRALSRRDWLGGTLGVGATGLLGAETASLGGAWDHRATANAKGRVAASDELGTGVPRLTHIGHSCHLFEVAGQRWLTDPWFFNPAFGSLTHASAIAVTEIGPLDGIFISHRHADHFDPSALQKLDKSARVWTADPSLLQPLAELGFARASLSNAWQTLQVGALELSFVPALHDVPQHSMMLVGPDARVLFCADTGPHDHWGEIRRRFRPTTALLPCDGTKLRWEPRQIMNPSEAFAAALALGCRQLLQTHADASYTDPIARYLLSSSEADPVGAMRSLLAQALTAQPSEASEASGAPSDESPPEFTPLRIGETRRLFS